MRLGRAHGAGATHEGAHREEEGEADGKALIGEYADPLEGAPRAATVFGLLALSLFMGALIGLFVQAMLQLMNFCIDFLWGIGGGMDTAWWLPLAICPAGGLVIGIWNARFHAAPESLEQVLSTVRKTGGYRVRKAPAAIVAFLLPLAFGGAVGPEAGLTGFIAGAATRISATLRRAGLRAKSLADVTVCATICAVFGAPFAGLVAGAEHMPGKVNRASTPDGTSGPDGANGPKRANAPDESGFTYRRAVKIVLYGLSAAGAFLGMWAATLLVGRGGGLPRFEGFAEMPLEDGIWIIVCIAAGYALALAFSGATRGFGALGHAIGGHDILKGLLAGIVLGILGALLPYVLFSGEEQGREIMDVWRGLPALALIATAFAKAAATPLCLEMGWRGGTIFPCIFSGVALGLGISAIIGIDPLFCATCTCAAFMGAKTRKPVLAAALLLLCFPVESIPWMIAAAAVGAIIPLPKALQEKQE